MSCFPFSSAICSPSLKIAVLPYTSSDHGRRYIVGNIVPIALHSHIQRLGLTFAFYFSLALSLSTLFFFFSYSFACSNKFRKMIT